MRKEKQKNNYDKQYFKTVEGNEGTKCHYATRLDTYVCECQHDCKYCYAKSILEFRGLWDHQNPCVAGQEKIRKIIYGLSPDIGVIRLGGMTDCFQPIERSLGVTLEAIKAISYHKSRTYQLLINLLLIFRLLSHAQMMSITSGWITRKLRCRVGE